MELTELRSELHRLAAIVEGWGAPEEITEIERDLALAKLRAIYEALRFDGITADADALPAGDASDFAAALELEPFSIEPDEPFVGASADEAVPDDTEPVAEEPEVEVELIFADEGAEEGLSEVMPAPAEPSEEVPAEPDDAVTGPLAENPAAGMPAVPEPTAECVPAPVAGAMAEAVETETTESDRNDAAMPAPEPVQNAAATPASEPVSEPGQNAAAMPVSEAAPEPVQNAAAMPASEPVSEPVQNAAAMPEPATPVGAPTLFGTEEATKRHRHRQRVIMSLYDADPAPVRSEPAVAAAEPAAAEPRTETPETGSATAEEGPVSVLERLAAVQGVSAQQTAPVGAQPETDAPALAGEVPADPAETPEPVVAGANFAGSGTVLGEVINHDVRTLGETIAPQRGEASELARTEPVTDLHRAIGINDKFLLLRDLFGGDEAAYGQAIDALNGMESLDDCMIWIAEHYAWNAGCDGAKFLMELLERKYA